TDFSISAIIQVRTANRLASLFQHAGHAAITACALPNFAAELFIIDQCECGPSGRREKVRSTEVSEPLCCRLEAAVQIVSKIGHARSLCWNRQSIRLVDLAIPQGASVSQIDSPFYHYELPMATCWALVAISKCSSTWEIC